MRTKRLFRRISESVAAANLARPAARRYEPYDGGAATGVRGDAGRGPADCEEGLCAFWPGMWSISATVR